MRKIKIIADSSCDILYQLKETNKDLSELVIIPLNVTFEQETYRDYFDLSSRDIIEKGKNLKVLPKTSAPSVGIYSEIFGKYINEDYDIIYIGLGSKFSSSYANSLIAKRDFPEERIYCIDSNSLSTGIGIKVLKALSMVKNGKSVKEIVEYLESIKTKSHCEFVCDTLEYIYKGGRCSGAAYLIGSMLRIKPLIFVNEDGMMEVGPKGLGKKQAVKILINRFKEHYLNNEVDDEFYLLTSFMADEDAQIVYDELIALGIPADKIYRSEACGTVASHCGPGCLGIIYIQK